MELRLCVNSEYVTCEIKGESYVVSYFSAINEFKTKRNSNKILFTAYFSNFNFLHETRYCFR